MKPTTTSLPPQASALRLASKTATADGIDDHVRTMPAGQRMHARAERILEIGNREIDHAIRPVGLDEGRLRHRREAGEGAGTEGLGELDRGDADPARGARRQHPLAGCEPRAVGEREIGGEIGQAHGSCHDQGDAGRDRIALDRGHDDLLGEGADLELGRDPLARPQGLNPLSDRAHDPRQLLARHEGEGMEFMVGAGDHHEVGIIEADRVHLDQHLAGARPRGRHLLEGQLRWCPEPLDEECAHEAPVPAQWPVRARLMTMRWMSFVPS